MANRDLEDLFAVFPSEWERLERELTSTRPKVAGSRYWEPRVDLFEDDRRYLIKVELPGVAVDAIQLLYVPERHAVLIRGHRTDDFSHGDGVGIHQLEILYGEFQREIRLPTAKVDSGSIRAQYRNGFLIVQIPKLERMASRTITIHPI